MAEIVLVEVSDLGKAYFRPLSAFQRDDICRACGHPTRFEVATEKPLEKGRGVAMPCCKKQDCYNGNGLRNVVDLIKGEAGRRQI